MNHPDARELLEATHEFPCAYTIKAIGAARDGFEVRIVRAARTILPRSAAVAHRARATPNGAHVAVTLVVQAQTPDEIITVYQALQTVDGLRFLL